MSKDIQVSTSRKGDIAIISIKGDITAATGDIIDSAYRESTVTDSPKILLQFDKDCYINSGGLAFLIDIASECRKKEQKLHVGVSYLPSGYSQRVPFASLHCHFGNFINQFRIISKQPQQLIRLLHRFPKSL